MGWHMMVISEAEKTLVLDHRKNQEIAKIEKNKTKLRRSGKYICEEAGCENKVYKSFIIQQVTVVGLCRKHYKEFRK